MRINLEKLGLIEQVAPKGAGEKRYLLPKNHAWRLVAWFSDFVNAPDIASLRAFKDEAAFLASTVAGSRSAESILKAAKDRLVRKDKRKPIASVVVTDDGLLRVQRDAREAIKWFLVERETGKDKIVAPLLLSPIEGEEILQWVGKKVERTFLPADFRGKILSRLFRLLSSATCHFWRCEICRKIFARRGRQLYCDRRCQIRARPIEDVREYQREYMRKIRRRARRRRAAS